MDAPAALRFKNRKLRENGSEPESQSNLDDASAKSIANHRVADPGITKANQLLLLVQRDSGIFSERINALEVGMIENVDNRGAELQ